MTKKAAYVSGRYRQDEQDYIRKWYGSKTVAELAKDLGRKKVSVERWIFFNKVRKKTSPRIIDSDFVAEKEDERLLHGLSDKLLPEEIPLAESTYKGMLTQFGTEIVYSDKLQIIDYCIVGCLLGRAIADEKRFISEMTSLQHTRDKAQKELEKMRKKRSNDEIEDFDEDSFIDRIEQYDIRIQEVVQSIMASKKHQNDLMKQKDTLTKSLNASRDQRSDQLAKANSSWGDVVKFYAENQVAREAIGLEAEKMRIGIKEEYIRLTSSPHMYVDGERDYPILNSEVIERNKVRVVDKNADAD